ncbi:hypothetical protein HD806DRAFT_285803 [Xylariaceae sp. AK1471]|nr:hypothetical protein HD806DRAFT_285803 [Xylariaceae sp. AK1471]
MLGLLKAALLLAPALALASPIAVETASTDTTSRALITLAIGEKSNSSELQQTTLDLRILESTTPCGYGNITVNGESLPQDDIGLGSGSITTEDGNVLVADWKFTCVHLEQDSQVQLLSFNVLSVDGRKVEDLAFSVQFRQTAPVSISYIDGPPAKLRWSSGPDSPDNHHASLEDELAELKMLKEQLLMLERSIALKVAHISKIFNFDRPEELLQDADCDSLKCLFKKYYHEVKGMASRLYYGGREERNSLAGQSGRSRWPIPHHGERHGDQQHPWLPSHHDNQPTSPRPQLSPPSPNHQGQHPLTDMNDLGKDFDSLPSLQNPGRVSSMDKTKHLKYVANESTNDGFHRALRIILPALVLSVLIMSVLISILSVRYLRQRRQDRWEQRRRRVRESRDACNALVVTKSLDLIEWLRDGLRRQSVADEEKQSATRCSHESTDSEDEEKYAVMRRSHESMDSEEEEDALSTTMEEEIAQFRAAAGAVSNLISAEEGRGRRSQHPLTRPRRDSTPSSITSACPTYRSVDDTLPPYDENSSPEYVVDGFRYTPGSSISAGATTTRASLDENLGRKD